VKDDLPGRLPWYFLVTASIALKEYLLPIALMFVEAIFVTDMLGATAVLTRFLNGVAVTSPG
jgi:hypothetical protein